MKLTKLDEWNARRSTLAAKYIEQLSTVSGLQLPYTPDWADPVWHIFAIRCLNRDALQAHLDHSGVGTLIHYPVPPHRSEAYAAGRYRQQMPLADEIAATTLSLPMGPHLQSADLEFVTKTLRSFA